MAQFGQDLPKLASKLHYRILDVSTIKELARRWYPDLPLPPKEMSGHRALSDIEDSIAGGYFFRLVGRNESDPYFDW